MPTSFTEKYDSRKVTTDKNGAPESAEFIYALRGVADENSARILAGNSIPAAYGVLVRRNISLEPVHVDTANLGACIWEVTVQYGVKDEPDTGDPPSFSFDTGGGTQHITQSLQTVGRYPGNAPNFGGAVGVTHDSVEGVDITVPVYQFSETHYLPAAVVTAAYRGTLFYLTGKVNSGSFRGLAPGECLFLGASGSRRGTGADDDWEISFKFAASPNSTGLQVGSIGGISKKGWEYMWVRYQDAEDEEAKVLIKKPVAVYIEKVYEQASFAGLGIGI